MLSAAKLTRTSRTWKLQGPRTEKTVFQPADIDGGTQTVNDRGSSPELASSQLTLFSSADLEDCQNDGDVNYISPNSRKKKKKKKKKNTGSADATSPMVDENAQDEDPIPNSTVHSDHETSLSTAAVHDAGLQSTLLSALKESDKEDPIQSGHAVKKKDNSKKTEITDSDFLGDDPKNGHEINGHNKDCASNDAGSVEVPLWADDRKEGLQNKMKTDKVMTESTDDQGVSVTKKKILVEPNYMYSDVDEKKSLERKRSPKNLDEIQEEEKPAASTVKIVGDSASHASVTEPKTSLESTIKKEHAGVLATSNGIKANPVNSGLRDVQAEKEEPGSGNEEDLSDLSDHEG